MAVRLDVGKISMTDVTNLKLGKHQIQDCVNYEGIYSTAHILSKVSNKGIAKIGLSSLGKYAHYFSDLNLVSKLQELELPEKSGSKFVKLDK